MSSETWVRWLWGACVVVIVGCGRFLPYPDDPELPATVAPGPGQPNSYQCECTCEDDAKTTEYGIVSRFGDAEERNGVMSVTDGTLDLGTTENGQANLVGLAFEGALPRGAEIVSAHVQFTAQAATNGAASFSIRAEHSAAPQPFLSTAPDLGDRNLAGATVSWSPPDWAAAGDRTAAQRTPDLKDVLNDLVRSVTWDGGGIVLVIAGSGGAPGRRAAWAWDGNAASAPVLSVTFRADRSAVFPLSVCMPARLNPNTTTEPRTEAELHEALKVDCAIRVTNTVNGLADACGYPACSCEVPPHPIQPAPAIAPPRFAIACDGTCEEERVAEDCSNFSPTVTTPTATNAEGDDPVCVAHSPLASALYGQRSQCELEGDALIEIEDEDVQRGARGTLMLVGRPCASGAGCGVGVEIGLDVDDAQFDTFFAEANFVQLSTVGKTTPGNFLVLDAAGAGSLARGLVESSHHGTRLPEDDDEVAETVAFTQRNTTSLPVTVDWDAGVCTLDGEVGSGSDFRVSFVDVLTGTLVNQPPTANAGSDQLDVECNVQGGARIVLDGTASSDPDRAGDGDLASIRWFAGSRSGPEVGYALKTVVSQTGLGANGTWVLRVVDGGGQSDEDSVSTRVVDTSDPTVVCNTPETIVPPDAEHPAVFTATASDVCAGTLTPALSSPTCYFINKAGKRVFRDECAVSLDGPAITITNSGGVGDFIEWTASASDGNGNSSSEVCRVQVVRKT